MNKKILLLVMGCVLAFSSIAQTLGVRAGFNLSTMQMKDDESEMFEDKKMQPGFHVGLTADFPVSEMFSFNTGLIFTQKGFSYSIEEEFLGEVSSMSSKLSLYYLDIPLTGKLSFGSNGTKFYTVLGPCVSFGLAGKDKFKLTESVLNISIDEERDVEWGSDASNDDFKRLDLGLMAGAGFEINRFGMGVYYNYGIMNIASDDTDGFSAKNRNLELTVTYRISK